MQSNGSSGGQVRRLFVEDQVGKEYLISIADRAKYGAGSGSESIRFSLVMDVRKSTYLVEPCGLDCMQSLLAVRPVRTTGNSGLLGIPGSVSRSPTEI